MSYPRPSRLFLASLLITLAALAASLSHMPLPTARRASAAAPERPVPGGAAVAVNAEEPGADPGGGAEPRAHCYCRVTVNGTEVEKTDDNGYIQGLHKKRCQEHCEGVWNGKNLLEWAKMTGACGPVHVKMEAAIGTAGYVEVRSATVEVPCPTPTPTPTPTPGGTGTGGTPVEYQYAAKFVCGASLGAGGQSNGIVAPGRYFTAINVHNPARSGRLAFRKKFAIALPRERAGRVSRFFDAALAADETFNVDCSDIYEHTETPAGQFVEGFAVFESKSELDVVAVYTAEGQQSRQVETLHSERVPGRPYTPTCAGDLNADLSTGRAAWTVQEPGASAPHAVAALPGPWNALPGTSWVGHAAGASTGGPVGDYTYRLCFCLCEGYSSPVLTLAALADNTATVSFNGTPLYSIPDSSWQGAPPRPRSFTDAALFRPGENCLTVQVNNAGGPTGLDLRGTLTAPGGACLTDGRRVRR